MTIRRYFDRTPGSETSEVEVTRIINNYTVNDDDESFSLGDITTSVNEAMDVATTAASGLSELTEALQALVNQTTSPALGQTLTGVSGNTPIDLSLGHAVFIESTAGDYSLSLVGFDPNAAHEVWLTIRTTTTGHDPTFAFDYVVDGVPLSDIDFETGEDVRFKLTKLPHDDRWFMTCESAKFTITGGDVLYAGAEDTVPAVNTDPPAGTRTLRYFPPDDYSGAGTALASATVGIDGTNASAMLYVALSTPYIPQIAQVRWWMDHPTPAALTTWDDNPSDTAYANSYIGAQVSAPFALEFDTRVDPTGFAATTWQADGSHTVRAQVLYTNTGVEVIAATFTVDNGTLTVSEEIEIIGTSAKVEYSTGGVMTPVYPASYTAVVDDDCFVFYAARISDTTEPTTPAGWTKDATHF
jgi:hypothetical protein